MLGELGVAAIICLLSILVALVILFNSLTLPLLIMLSIPFGLVGVVLCYSVQGLSMGIMSMTGVIGLVGVVVSDSLVLLHSLNEERRDSGAMLSAADVAAVAKRRFRPILITSVTTAAHRVARSRIVFQRYRCQIRLRCVFIAACDVPQASVAAVRSLFVPR